MKQRWKTTSLCPDCAGECGAHYEERADGLFLLTHCPVHGGNEEKVESDPLFFEGCYEHDYPPLEPHLVLPVTYRCNLACRYCYSLSNSRLPLPPDRTLERLLEIIATFPGNVTLIGGEPTLREDLFDLVRQAKVAAPARRISLGTNGQKLDSRDCVAALQGAGLDFVFLSLNDPAYEASALIRDRKLHALEHCLDLGLPVWLQQTLDEVSQVESTVAALERFGAGVFNVTIRVVKPFGLRHPRPEVFVSDLLRHLGLSGRSQPGTSPFNRRVRLVGKRTKLCSWVMDTRRVDPVDSSYLISDDRVMPFHRGMRTDEVLIKQPRRCGRNEAVVSEVHAL